jgi:hypothetical protein
LRPIFRVNIVGEPAPPAILGIRAAMWRPKRPRWMRVTVALTTIAVGAGTLT